MNYYYCINDQTEGPIQLAEIAARISKGSLPPDVLCCMEGQETWVSFPELPLPDNATNPDTSTEALPAPSPASCVKTSKGCYKIALIIGGCLLAVGISLIAVFVVFAYQVNNKEWNGDGAAVISKIEKAVDSGNYSEALTKAKPHARRNNPQLNTLIAKAEAMKRKADEEAQAKAVTAQQEENLALADDKLREERLAKIKSSFSVFDGSHRGLTRLIKQGLNDPKSYEHVETSHKVMADYMVVTTVFRGKNAFGALVKNQVTAKVDFEGNVLEIIEQDP